jgi:fatty acid desaturase
MLKQADEADKNYNDQVEEMIKPLRERSDFMKVMAFNSPKVAIIFAVIGVAIAGGVQPFLGWIFADMLLTLSLPVEFIKLKLL